MPNALEGGFSEEAVDLRGAILVTAVGVLVWSFFTDP
jgi:hypothetical protein